VTLSYVNDEPGRRRERMELKPTPQLRPERVVAGLLTLVLVIGASWALWNYVGTNVLGKHRQGQMATALAKQWEGNRKGDASTDKLRFGDVFAVMQIERFGKEFKVPVVAGVDDVSLSSGVGWFPDSQRPGELGNFAVAGHRVTHGQPFGDFPELRAGDLVKVETRTHVFTYELQNSGKDLTVGHTDTWVIQQVPEVARKKKNQRSTTEPTEAILTMTTCSEIFHTDNRSVVFGKLVKTETVDP